MFDASVALLGKVGVPMKKFLGHLKDMLKYRKFLSQGAFVMKYIQREDGINPEIQYLIGVEPAAPVYVGAVDPEFKITIVHPQKGLFRSFNFIFTPGDTGLSLESAQLTDGGKTITFQTTGTAVAGTFTVEVLGVATLNGRETLEAVYEIIIDPEA